MILDPLPLTVLLAAKNEQVNLPRCLAALKPARRVVILDSQSSDQTSEIASAAGAEIIQFAYCGGYPKKRQWALDQLSLETPWVLLLDADEVVAPELWDEIRIAISSPQPCAGYLITKGFHFLGRRFRFGGFSFASVLLFQRGKARFERIHAEEVSAQALDMEVHERLIVEGPIGTLRAPLIHEDFKGLHAYIDRHNRYSSWEAAVRHAFLTTGRYGEDTIQPRFFGNTQERRRWLKKVVMRAPFESWLWFAYHYFFRLGFLEGRRGLIASQVRASYISQVRAKIFELQLGRRADRIETAQAIPVEFSQEGESAGR